MAHAHCQNEDCGHDWTLQKAPGEYKNGVRCPSCGSTKVDIEFDGTREQTQSQPQAHNGQAQQGQAQAPARQQQGQAQAPANTGGIQFGEPETAGDAAAQALVSATSEEVSTQQKAQAAKSIGGAVVDGVTRLMQYQDEISKRQEEHAKGVDLQKADDKPRCDECGHVFSKIPMSKDRIQCPGCGVEYIVN